MVLKRVPSFSGRPNFPSGLQILVVDSEESSRQSVETQLKALSYEATCCSSCSDAVEQLGTSKYDIVLADSKLLAKEGDELVRFIESARTLPLVLVCQDSSADDVLKGIKLGACDFLEKPLSSLKLKNIWQHVVRKLMESMQVEQTSEVEGETCATNKAGREQSSNVKGKSMVSAPVPNTPSPAASGADIASVATTASKAGDAVVGESSSSETRKENSSGDDLTTECSDLKSCAGGKSCKATAATPSSATAPAAAAAPAAADANRPPLAAKSAPAAAAARQQQQQQPAAAPAAAAAAPVAAAASAPQLQQQPAAFHPGMPPFAPMFMPGSWGQPVMGTPMAPPAQQPPYHPQYAPMQMPPPPPGMGGAGPYGHHHHHLPMQMPHHGFVPTPMGPGGMAYAPAAPPPCPPSYLSLDSCATTASLTGLAEPDLSGATADEPAPIGLRLKKSASLLNLISERLGQRAC